MSKKAIGGLGLVLMLAGIGAANIKVDTTWHYFGNGILFGIGACLAYRGFKQPKNKVN